MPPKGSRPPGGSWRARRWRPSPTGCPSASASTGTAFVGAVGDRNEVQDFTALGDTVNATARLASVAGAGEALISVDAAIAARLATRGLERRHLEVKGRTEPIDVVVLRTAG
jgi:adenylate cyclase